MPFIRLQNIRIGLATNSSSSHSMIISAALLSAPPGMTVKHEYVGFSQWPQKASAVLNHLLYAHSITYEQFKELKLELFPGDHQKALITAERSLGEAGIYTLRTDPLLEQLQQDIRTIGLDAVRSFFGATCPLRDPHVVLVHEEHDEYERSDLEGLLLRNLHTMRASL